MTKEPARINAYKFSKNGPASLMPFALPAQRRGKHRIEIEIEPAGATLPIVSFRNAFFMGLKPSKLKLTEPTEIHKLRLSDPDDEMAGTLMSTMPQELEQHERQLKRAKGHVLIGGLGLGVAVGILARNPKVTDITVIEKSADVIAMVEPFLPRLKNFHPPIVLQRDLFRHLKMVKKRGMKYDFAFYDIWSPTGQRIFSKFTLPLRKLSIGIVDQKNIECWNEDEIIGQSALAINTRLQMPATLKPILEASWNEFEAMKAFNGEIWPFLKWLRTGRDKSPDQMNRAAEVYVKAMKDAEAYAKWE